MKTQKPEFPLVLSQGSSSVKIYRGTNRGRDVFTLVYSIAGERRRQNFADLKAVKIEAQVVLTSLENGAAQALTLTASDRDSYIAAKQVATAAGVPLHSVCEQFLNAQRRLKGKATLAEAVEYFTRHFDPDLPTMQPDEVLTELLAAKRKDGASEVYLKLTKIRLEKFGVAFKKPIGTISSQEIDAWLRRLEVGTRTRNNYRAEIVALFTFAKECGYLPRDRQTEAALSKRPRSVSEAIEVFTPGEIKTILAAVKQSEVPFVALAAFAGLRTAELQRLDWAEVNFDERFIEITAKNAKTSQRRIVPMQDNLAAWLLPYRMNRGQVCPWLKTQTQVQKAAVKAGVKWKRNALRHSFGSYRLEVCKSAPEVALEMGNSPRMVFANYRKVVTPSAAKEYWSIQPGGQVGLPVPFKDTAAKSA